MRRSSLVYAAFLVPAVLLVLGLVAYPLIYSFVISMHSGSTFNIENSEYVGFANYKAFFADPNALLYTRNSFIRGFGGVIPSYIIGFLAALALNRATRGMRGLQVVVLLPFVISGPIAINTWKLVFDPITGVPAALGLDWGNLFANEQTVWPTLLFMNAWGSFQFYSILLLAGLQRIPTEQYEAVEVDGGGRLAKFRNVTMPALLPISAAICVFHFMGSFQEFNLIYLATGGGPLNATQTLATYAYQLGFGGGFSVGLAAATTFIAAVIMALTIGIMGLVGWLVIRAVGVARVKARVTAVASKAGDSFDLLLAPVTRRRAFGSAKLRPKRNRVIPVAALAFAIFSSIPTLYLLSQSFDGRPPGPGTARIFPAEFTLDNWISVLTSDAIWRGTATAPALIRNFGNSVLLVIVVTTGSVLVASLGGYALARWRGSVGRLVVNGFSGLLLFVQMIPGMILIFPLYLMAAKFGLLNPAGLMIILIAGGLPMALLYFRVYFAGSSREIEEAAAIDGAGALRTFFTIVVPNAASAIAAIAAFSLIGTWNEFLLSLTLVQDPASRTFPPAIAQFMRGNEFMQNTPPGGIAVLLLIPIIISAVLLALMLKQFTTAMAGGGTKG
ncbi:ABC transporter permease [Occultella gossypii]|uniref:ABC transporter permease subunit n=1 Tax=Occultella gossypii TaxID=2800820 RepID=A0ABS7S5C6_9MICO|nr:ABC transporter permease subunit [Occultella gossypii]MBZ2195543.1 ABC transporter permease subunit [Occultella gossypii]